jgi:hypothetical protein
MPPISFRTTQGHTTAASEPQKWTEADMQRLDADYRELDEIPAPPGTVVTYAGRMVATDSTRRNITLPLKGTDDDAKDQ